MAITGLANIVGGHRLFAGLSNEFLELVAGCAKNVTFKAGEFLEHEGAPVEFIYLIRTGKVSLEISASGRGSMTFLTAGPDDMIGLAWLVPPYRWHHDARALEDTRAIAMSAECLRNKCEADAKVGYEVMKRFMPTVLDRLHATRLQLLDVYGDHR